MTDLGALAPGLLVLGLVAVVVAIRSIRMARGAPVSGARLFAYGAVYVLLLAFVLLADAAWRPVYGYALDALALGAAFALSVPYVAGRVALSRRADGQWVYRLGWSLPVIYLALFFARFALDLVVLGPSAYAGAPVASPSALPPGSVDALLLVDALFSASAGLLLGRNVAVYLAYRRRSAAAPPTANP